MLHRSQLSFLSKASRVHFILAEVALVLLTGSLLALSYQTRDKHPMPQVERVSQAADRQAAQSSLAVAPVNLQNQAKAEGLNTWTTNGPNGGWINQLAIDPQTPITLYTVTSGGLFKSTNERQLARN